MTASATDPGAEERLRQWSGRALLAPRDAPLRCKPDEHGVGAFLHRHGIDLCLGDRLSPGVHRAVAVEMTRAHEFARVMRALHDRFSGQLMVYKGQALAYSIYPQPWLRPRGDTDILVERPAVSRLLQEMETLGYERLLSTDGDLVMPQTSVRREFGGMAHVWDIHWEISNRPAFAGMLSCAELRHSAMRVEAGGTTFSAPAHSDSLLIACLHLIGHHAGDPRMIWLYDIHLLAAALDDDERQRFLDKATASAPSRDACLEALALTRRYLPDEATEALYRTLDPGAGGPSRTPDRSYLGRLAVDMRALGPRNRLRFLRQHVFPSPEYMTGRFGIRRRWQLPFWYAVRIARAIPKLFRRR